MSPEYAHEWVRKAKADRMAAERAFADCKKYKDQAEIACFHAQQCVEKYLKAILSYGGFPVHRVHDLLAVARKCRDGGFPDKRMESKLRLLNQYAVEIRYPGASASSKEARRAISAMNEIVQTCEKILNADSTESA